MYYKGTGLPKFNKDGVYIMQDTSYRKLNDNYFRYVRSMSGENETIYEHIFPVYRYHAAVTLEARFLLCQETGEIVVDVFDAGSKGIYGPWYYDNSGIHAKLIDIINSNISKEMKKLDIIEQN